MSDEKIGAKIVKRESPVQLSSQDAEALIVYGDLAKLSPAGRVIYYRLRCESLGLDSNSKPFDLIMLNGKMVLYANKNCAEQLRQTHHVSLSQPKVELLVDIYQVTVSASLPSGRTDTDIGAVDIKNLSGEKLANATMKAFTKAKRRVTLSICGLGMLDETEVETIPSARRVQMTETGEVIEEKRTLHGKTYSAEGPHLPGPCGMCEKQAVAGNEVMLACEDHQKHLRVAGSQVASDSPGRAGAEPTFPSAPKDAEGVAHQAPSAEEPEASAPSGPSGSATESATPAPTAKPRGRPKNVTNEQLAAEIGLFLEKGAATWKKRLHDPSSETPDAAYYAVLGNFGVNHANELKSTQARIIALVGWSEAFKRGKVPPAVQNAPTVAAGRPSVDPGGTSKRGEMSEIWRRVQKEWGLDFDGMQGFMDSVFQGDVSESEVAEFLKLAWIMGRGDGVSAIRAVRELAKITYTDLRAYLMKATGNEENRETWLRMLTGPGFQQFKNNGKALREMILAGIQPKQDMVQAGERELFA